MPSITSLFMASLLGTAIFASPMAAIQERSPFPVDTTPSNTNLTPFPFNLNEDNIANLTLAFDNILNIPDSILSAGPETVKGWAKDHNFGQNQTPAFDARDVSLEARVNPFAIANCVFELGKAVVEGYLPIAKLRKVKDLIKEAGGAAKAAKALLKADKLGDLVEFGEALVELAEVLGGVDGVVDACFGWI